jgi:PQQ-dependent dehydrogenase (s-GDH family)
MRLYQSEQGPKTDDEVNVLVAGKNYGWPHVAGDQDDMAYEYGNWSAAPDCEELTFSDYELPPSVPRSAESDWSHPDFMPPIATFFTVPTGHNFRDPACAGAEFICWPTIAAPSIDIYARDDGIPGWSTSLLVPSLKQGSVFVAKLDESGTRVVGEPKPALATTNRYRDVALSPDGHTIYVITDNEGFMRAPDGGFTAMLDNPGSLLAFTHQP